MMRKKVSDMWILDTPRLVKREFAMRLIKIEEVL